MHEPNIGDSIEPDESWDENPSQEDSYVDILPDFERIESNQIIDIFRKYFPASYFITTEKLARSLQNESSINKQVKEWVELHHHFHMVLSAFEPFSTQVLGSAEPINPNELYYLWYPVNTRTLELLEWAGTIQWIGVPFVANSPGDQTGELWAFDLKYRVECITKTLEEQPKHRHWGTQKSVAFQWISGISRRVIPNWWTTLLSQTRNLNHTLLLSMHYADHQLNNTISRKAIG